MREVFFAAADTARPLLDRPELAQSWDRPSALERMTIGALGAHLARAVTVVPDYLEQESRGPYTDAAGYFLRFSEQLDSDLESESATAVRSRAEATAEAGPKAVISSWDDARRRLGTRLPPEDESRGIAVPGSSMLVADYLVTRIVELVVHSDDLAASLGVETPQFNGSVTDPVISCLVEIARRRSAPMALIRAMTRTERADLSVLRVF